MSDLSDAVCSVVSGWLSSPTSEPLVIEQVAGRVVFSRGVPAPFLSVSEAASFFGVSRSTLYRNYIDTKLLTVTDKGISRRDIERYMRR